MKAYVIYTKILKYYDTALGKLNSWEKEDGKRKTMLAGFYFYISTGAFMLEKHLAVRNVNAQHKTYF